MGNEVIYNRIHGRNSGGDSIFLPKHLRCGSHTLNIISTRDFQKYVDRSEIREQHEEAEQKRGKVWSLLKRPMSS